MIAPRAIAALTEGIEAMEPIDLAELDRSAQLLRRRDRKYLVPTDRAAWLVAALGGRGRVLQIGDDRSFRYESVYFDTPDLRSFYAAARRRTQRYKVRTRTYLDSGRCMVELKVRDARGTTTKHRLEYDLDRRDQLDEHAVAFVSTSRLVGLDGARLRPVLWTSYRRTTLLVDDRARVTIDRDVVSATTTDERLALVGMAVVETKTPGPPSTADRLLWAVGERPIAISKFATTLAALRPGLPANRWARALAQPWVWEVASEPDGQSVVAVQDHADAFVPLDGPDRDLAATASSNRTARMPDPPSVRQTHPSPQNEQPPSVAPSSTLRSCERSPR